MKNKIPRGRHNRRLKNRRNMIIAATLFFATGTIAGSAYAFTTSGPLSITGSAMVEIIYADEFEVLLPDLPFLVDDSPQTPGDYEVPEEEEKPDTPEEPDEDSSSDSDSDSSYSGEDSSDGYE